MRQAAYRAAVDACGLGADLSSLSFQPLGDATVVGARGRTLSGGQRDIALCFITTTVTGPICSNIDFT